MHAISPEVMEALMEAVDVAEADFQGMVIWSGDAPFSVGADLEATMPAFVIGGADGIAPDLRARADLSVSFGRMVWPHLLVRVMLAEQLYRAATILAGGPYHRA